MFVLNVVFAYGHIACAACTRTCKCSLNSSMKLYADFSLFCAMQQVEDSLAAQRVDEFMTKCLRTIFDTLQHKMQHLELEV